MRTVLHWCHWEDIRSVTVRGFTVCIIFISNSMTLFTFCESTKISHMKEVSLWHRVLTKKDVIILCEELEEV